MTKLTNQTPPEVLQKAIDDVSNPETPAPVTPAPATPAPAVPETPETPEGEEPETPAPVTPAPATPAPAVPEDTTDWKARYAGQTRESQVLAAKNKQMTEIIEQAATLPDPTEEEMKKEYGDNWDEMDAVQKKMAKEALISTRRFNMIHKVVDENKKGDEWIEKIKQYTQDPKTITTFPQLQGHEVEFVQFCSLPSRIGVGIDDLVRAFSFDLKPVKPKRENLFETAGGGPAPAPKEMTVEQIAFLRTHNSREYQRLIKAGKIKIDL